MKWAAVLTLTLSACSERLPEPHQPKGLSTETGNPRPIETTPLAVTSTNPGNGQTGVLLNTPIDVTFNEPINWASLTTTSFRLMAGTTPVPGTVVGNSRIAIFTPGAILAASTTHTATISTGVTDCDGNALPSAYSWTFTTGTLAEYVSQQARTASAAEVNETNPIRGILDKAVRMVEGKVGPIELKEAPRSIDEAAKAYGAINRRMRIYEQVEYKGWWLFSKSPYPFPEGKGGLRFHDGYGIEPGTKQVYAFGFW